jgi:CRP-like cAMP-binding protein
MRSPGSGIGSLGKTVDRRRLWRYAPACIAGQFKLNGGDHIRHRIPQKQIDLLKSVPLFSGCSQSELRTIAQLGTPVDVEKGRMLTTKGAIGREFFLVLSGVASCRLGRRQVDQFTTGGYFGELALLHGGIRTADVVAETAMELLALDRREFKAMLMTTPSIGVKMLDRLADRLADADAHYSD